MKRSEKRILTTHVGRLQRPDDLTVMMGENFKRRTDSLFAQELHRAVEGIVKRQSDAGINVVCDGEFGRPNWNTYLHGRLGGHEVIPLADDNCQYPTSRDRTEFSEYYDELAQTGTTYYRSPGGEIPQGMRWACTSPASYVGQDVLQQDLDNLKSAVQKVHVDDAFMPSTSPIRPGQNEYYSTNEEYYIAVGEAMREEYRAIVDSGFVLQIDDPHLPAMWDHITPGAKFSQEMDLSAYQKAAERHVEIVNHALRGLPEDRIRYHICWGAWHGPHAHDIPLKSIVNIMLKVKAQAYLIEAANARHEHEWMVWKEVKLPEGKVLAPGVVSHATSVVEHPELVAWRIKNFAGVVGRENVIASTDCGLGYRVHPQVGWAKLKALVHGAQLATNELW